MLLVSACLIGEPVRYDGKSCPNTRLMQLLINKKAQALCPELLGGFTTPRLPAEIVGGTGQDVLDGKAKVIDSSGLDVTELYLKGEKITGVGITTALLQRHGFEVISENEIEDWLIEHSF
ncbi:DUF523 domain-containing protein [Acinetobacter pittii]|uniref:DUF523 domain-containing protein n=1 Tax=Acinetobacter pittii TaxID=48296 RepID=UPI0032674622